MLRTVISVLFFIVEVLFIWKRKLINVWRDRGTKAKLFYYMFSYLKNSDGKYILVMRKVKKLLPVTKRGFSFFCNVDTNYLDACHKRRRNVNWLSSPLPKPCYGAPLRGFPSMFVYSLPAPLGNSVCHLAVLRTDATFPQVVCGDVTHVNSRQL